MTCPRPLTALLLLLPLPAVLAAGPKIAAFAPARSVLERRCVSCHSGKGAQAGLDLTSRAAILRGTGGRPAAVPGKSAASPMVRRAAAGTMPPGGGLPAEEVESLRRWVDVRLPWEGGALAAEPKRAGPDWWSLQPLKAAAVPAEPAAPGVPDTSRAIDAFVARRLRQSGLGFSPPASRRDYLRRVTYDLHGLPPTEEELRAFEGDRSPDAYERVVDRLLASPRYGERAARRWLDVVRFAESDGYEHDDPRLNAWPYRDWVIEAFNRDLPYERFAAEQLAGDALHPEDPKAGIPTGFLVAGGYDDVGAKGASPMMRAEVRQDELEDMIGTTSQVFLGLTAQCARCHDHKFDPIPQRDYYRLAAALSGARHMPPPLKGAFYGVRSEDPAPTRLLIRGSVAAPGDEVRPGVLTAVPAAPDPFAGTQTVSSDPERRRRLAAWISDVRNPLFARVIANRVWSWMFHQGLVATPNDFGYNGARPTHPELLDYLASTFIAPPPRGLGRSIKALHRAIVLSRTYRQSAAWNAKAAAVDAGNRFLWRHNPRRLEAEELRDTLLVTAGKLNPKGGGPGFQLFTYQLNAGALYEPRDPDDPDCYRRAIYRMVVRGGEDPLLTSFDCPDPSNTTPRRPVTTTATQALSLLNNRFTERMSGFLAERVHGADGVRAAFRAVLRRDPSPSEVAQGADFARKHGLRAWCRVLFNTSEFLTVE